MYSKLSCISGAPDMELNSAEQNRRPEADVMNSTVRILYNIYTRAGNVSRLYHKYRYNSTIKNQII